MKITFLGTGTSQGVPVIACQCPVCQSADPRDQRLRASVHIEVDGQSIAIDTGPDFRAQMLRAKVSDLDAVLLTHAHKDHVAGLDDIRPFYFRRQMQDMPLYGQAKVLEQIRREFAYMFEEVRYPGVPAVAPQVIEKDTPFRIGPTLITPVEVMHYRLPVLGFRIYDFTYITDANYIAPEEVEKVKGSKILVLNALQLKNHISHYNLEQAIAVAREIGAEQTYFTHISHSLGAHATVDPDLPDGISLAYDGLTLSL